MAEVHVTGNRSRRPTPTSSWSAPVRAAPPPRTTWPGTACDVLLLEKTEFPREKVCGDGLTPRAVKQLIEMGIDAPTEAGWLRNRGLRVIGGGVRLELDWPELASFPDYGLIRTRLDFDDLLAQRAVEAGAELRDQHQRHRPGARRRPAGWSG